MWNDIVTLSQIGTSAKWIAAILALIAGTSGVVAIIADHRIDTLKFILKRTPPKLAIELKAYEHGKFFVHIESLNLVPFELNYMLLNRSGQSLTGIPIEWAKAFPTKESRVFSNEPHLDLSKIPDGHVRLRLNFRSINYEKLRVPELAGVIEQEYDINKGYPIRIHHQDSGNASVLAEEETPEQFNKR